MFHVNWTEIDLAVWKSNLNRFNPWMDYISKFDEQKSMNKMTWF